MKKKILTPLMASALLLAAATSTHAANRTFAGAISNLWSNAGNWTGGAPTAADAPRLDKGKSVVLSYSAGTVGAIYIGSTSGTNTLLIQNGGSISSGTVYVATASGQTASLTLSTGSYLVAGSNGISMASGAAATNAVATAQIEGDAFYQGALFIGCSTSNPSGSSATMTFSGADFTVTSSTNTFRVGQNGTAVLKLGATDFGTIYSSGVSFSAGAHIVIDGSNFTAERTSDINIALLIYRNAPSDLSGATITFTNFDESYGDLTVADNIDWVNPTGTVGQEGYQEGYMLLHISAIPEPALAGLLVGALAITFAVRRRRQS